MSEARTESSPAEARPDISMFAPEKPHAVRANAAAADDMIRALAAAARGETPPVPAGGQEAARVSAEPVAPPAATGGEGAQAQPGTEKPQASPPVDPTPSTNTESAELAALRADLARAKQDISTWKGRHDAETKRERAAREAAEQKLAEAQAALDKATAAPPEPALSPDEIDTYGEELLKTAMRYAMPHIESRISAAVAGLRAEVLGRLEDIGGKAERVETTIAKNEFDGFLERLTARMKNWKEIDSDPAFKAWLDSPDEFFGVQNRIAIDSAVDARDIERTARVFERFLSQQGARGSQGTTTTAAPQSGTGDEPTAPTTPAPQADPLAAFAAPGKPSPSQHPAQPGAQPGAKVWTITEIQNFYGERTRGMWRGREAEADRVERDIAAAQREGRVR